MRIFWLILLLATGTASAQTPAGVDRTDWWSLKPLKAMPPAGKGNPVDTFIRAKLVEKGLGPVPEADARTLIRRVFFDLTGLPPSPEEVRAFVSDHSAQAYEHLVDRLLESPRYGERWARHWLDVVHYGETHGYDKDKPRPNAWPYRDYVIRAFNQDKPYARFIQEQLAGDVLYPGTVDGVVGLGFISAGPWDYIGHAEVPETKLDGKIARHLDRDDMVQNTIGSFCSLTIGCAQCHYHKFDAISQEDYYSLQAVFAALDRTDIKYYPGDALMRQFTDLERQRQAAAERLAALEAPLKGQAGEAYLALTRRIEGATDKVAQSKPNARPDHGYHSAISPLQEAEKWVQVDLGATTSIDHVELNACYDDFNKIGAGFGFPVRFKVETSDDPEFKTGVTLFWTKHDRTFMNDFANPGLKPFISTTAKGEGTKGRYVRLTAVKLAPRLHDYILALAEMRVFDQQGNNVALGKPVTALDSIEAPPRWRKSNLTDGLAPEERSAEDKEKLTQERDELLLSFADEKTQASLKSAHAGLALAEAGLRQLPPPLKVYAGGIHTGTGPFRGTGAEGGRPRVIQVLKRGDVKTPGEEVGPGTVEAIARLAGLPGRFNLPPESGEGARRAALAQWIVDTRNPLTWRSIVNRVWQYHFGKGLVDTPNDFGRMGGQPSHPELLDWLASTFRDDMKGSFKQLHKLIVCSATYRQSSSMAVQGESETSSPGNRPSAVPNPQLIDADNRLLWRQNRRKLDAESIRDSVLAVSGRLDLTMGGPSFQDFTITHPEHSPHYEYELHDPEDPKACRRSIYRFIVRSQQQPFMTVMDCADPSMRVDKRNESLSALQALAMMNNSLIVTMARHLAERAGKEAAGLENQVARAFELALSRAPAVDELQPLTVYARQEGLENTCRVLMNLNEFSFVD
ncbi:MAG: hypothetical protein JWO94_1151 [Verrucomicrobiaceae bacterium]|nr:hypothetical protein [Verrucomicrobiaceae bacterium]